MSSRHPENLPAGAMGGKRMSFGKILRVVLAIVVVLATLKLLSSLATTVPVGHVGVSHLFGQLDPEELPPGLHWINPLRSVELFDVRIMESKESLTVPTKEGLIAGLDVSVLYRIQPDKADEIYAQVGTQYDQVIVHPYVRNVVRDVIAGFSSEDLYSPNREHIARDITTRLSAEYVKHGIVLENVLLRDVRLPAQVTDAIEKKIRAKQEAEQMQYVLQKEKQEAERKKVEAEGIAASQKIVAESLDAQYLQWKYIMSLESVIKSPNTSTVILPFDQKLTPLLPVGPRKAEEK